MSVICKVVPLLFVSAPFDRACRVNVSIYPSGACVILQGQSLSESRSLCAVTKGNGSGSESSLVSTTSFVQCSGPWGFRDIQVLSTPPPVITLMIFNFKYWSYVVSAWPTRSQPQEVASLPVHTKLINFNLKIKSVDASSIFLLQEVYGMPYLEPTISVLHRANVNEIGNNHVQSEGPCEGLLTPHIT